MAATSRIDQFYLAADALHRFILNSQHRTRTILMTWSTSLAPRPKVLGVTGAGELLPAGQWTDAMARLLALGSR
jgi:hypothetical protein